MSHMTMQTNKRFVKVCLVFHALKLIILDLSILYSMSHARYASAGRLLTICIGNFDEINFSISTNYYCKAENSHKAPVSRKNCSGTSLPEHLKVYKQAGQFRNWSKGLNWAIKYVVSHTCISSVIISLLTYCSSYIAELANSYKPRMHV